METRLPFEGLALTKKTGAWRRAPRAPSSARASPPVTSPASSAPVERSPSHLGVFFLLRSHETKKPLEIKETSKTYIWTIDVRSDMPPVDLVFERDRVRSHRIQTSLTWNFLQQNPRQVSPDARLWTARPRGEQATSRARASDLSNAHRHPKASSLVSSNRLVPVPLSPPSCCSSSCRSCSARPANSRFLQQQQQQQQQHREGCVALGEEEKRQDAR